MQERLQLAGAVLERRGRQLAELPELTPLLRFTRGNPLTILVTMGEALRAGIDTSARVDAFVTALRGGEVDFADEASEGRSKSLGASLSYGFDTAFTDDERKVLALLHLFQVFINVDVLRAMGNPKAEWCLAHVRGLTRDRGIALLDRAAEIGLLHAHGNGYYGIHPALPWYFSALFSRDFYDDSDGARRAFAGAMGNSAILITTYTTTVAEKFCRASWQRKTICLRPAVLPAPTAGGMQSPPLCRAYGHCTTRPVETRRGVGW